MLRRSLFLLLLAAAPAPVRADDAARKQTVAYLRGLQTAAGGFRAAADDAEPTLKATSSAVRALHYLKGDVPDPAAAAKFVAGCFDPATGGFRDTPVESAKADVFTTAVGVMAVAALKMPKDKFAAPAAKFLTERAQGFEEIRIAAAGFEALITPAPRAKAWVEAIKEKRNADGGFGAGEGKARATGGAVAALLRLGADPGDRKALFAAIDRGQRGSGGFGKEDAPNAADLETTYRVMRALHLLKHSPPDVEGVRSFVAKCRNADGGYAVAPGRPSSAAGTYYAAVIQHWLSRPE